MFCTDSVIAWGRANLFSGNLLVWLYVIHAVVSKILLELASREELCHLGGWDLAPLDVLQNGPQGILSLKY